MYPKFKHLLFSLLTVLAALVCKAQDDPYARFSYTLSPSDTILHFNQKFSINSGEIPSFDPLDNFFQHIQSIEECDTTVHIHIIGHASIDGKDELNKNLSQKRAYAVRDTIVRYFDVHPSKISTTCTGEDWDLFTQLVLNDEKIPERDRVLQTIGANITNEEKESKIRGYAVGNTWEYLNANIFPQMRTVTVAWVLSKRALEPKVEMPVEEVPVVREIVEEVMEMPVEEPEILPPADDWRHKFYIKTNVLGWAALMVNGALEFDLAKHWSFSVAGYWAGWNYIKDTIKFRNGTVMPEFRYWPKADNTGFFLNLHGAASWFNVAIDGDYRYQTREPSKPALGGGLGIGWRFYFCRNHRWMMEAALGGGCYRVEYDRFLNQPKGRLIDTKKKTLFCLDQIAFSFVYAIPMK